MTSTSVTASDGGDWYDAQLEAEVPLNEARERTNL